MLSQLFGFRGGVAALILGFLMAATPVPADELVSEHTLIRPFHSSRIYWVDQFGIAHHVKNIKTLHKYFGPDKPLVEISQGTFTGMHVGGPVTIVTPPSLFDSQRDPQEISLDPGHGARQIRISMDELERLDELNNLEDLEDLEDLRPNG